MRFGFGRPRGAMRQVVRQKASEYDLTRRTDDSKGRFGESDGSTTTVSNIALYLFEPSEINLDTQYGDRLGGDLQGLAMPNADLQFDDTLTHGTDDYEVEEIMHVPSESDKVLKMFSLQRKTN